jgi:hypothetical protein
LRKALILIGTPVLVIIGAGAAIVVAGQLSEGPAQPISLAKAQDCPTNLSQLSGPSPEERCRFTMSLGRVTYNAISGPPCACSWEGFQIPLVAYGYRFARAAYKTQTCVLGGPGLLAEDQYARFEIPENWTGFTRVSPLGNGCRMPRTDPAWARTDPEKLRRRVLWKEIPLR